MLTTLFTPSPGKEQGSQTVGKHNAPGIRRESDIHLESSIMLSLILPEINFEFLIWDKGHLVYHGSQGSNKVLLAQKSILFI